jgi:SAM-dependent methyltransferase
VGNIEKFDSIAAVYDTPARMATAAAVAEKIRRAVPGCRGTSALDYGCGTGLVGLRLLDFFSSLLFVDASAGMVEQVRGKLQQTGAKNGQALRGDFLSAIPPGMRVDTLLLVQVLLHEREPAALLARLRLVLRDGGHLILVDFDKNEQIHASEIRNGFDQSELAGDLKALGFSPVVSETFYRGEKILMNQDASMFILDAIVDS